MPLFHDLLEPWIQCPLAYISHDKKKCSLDLVDAQCHDIKTASIDTVTQEITENLQTKMEHKHNICYIKGGSQVKLY